MATNARLSEAAAARQSGISRQAVHEWVKRGLIAKGPDGLLCAGEVETLRASLHPSAKASAPPAKPTEPTPNPTTPPAEPSAPASDDAGITSYHVAKTLREAAEARIAQLKLAEMRGDLVRMADVRSAYAKRIAAARQALLQMPSRVTPLIVADPSAGAVERHLRREISRVLESVFVLES